MMGGADEGVLRLTKKTWGTSVPVKAALRYNL